jgi:hypothetical protein
MFLKNINFNSSQDYLHMERYINVGSPSGFTDKYTTSIITTPKGKYENFYLCGINFPDKTYIKEFGKDPNIFIEWQMLVHPDMVFNPLNNDFFSKSIEIELKAVKVAPLASSRTVKVLNDEGWFIKLHYDGLIGRVNRKLGIDHALSAIEVSSYIVKAIDSHILPNYFFIKREPYARVANFKVGDKVYEYGMVYRESDIYPKISQKHYLIPAFSLFSIDETSPNDPTLLVQLISKQTKKVEDYLFEDIISPVYESYFSLLLNLGLQLECHAQNTLFVIDKNFKILGMVAIDAESIDKDISLMDEQGIKYNFQTLTYKCRYKENYKYKIMHSFMFDFKLGEYLISPLIDEAHRNFPFNKRKLIEKIKEFNNSFIAKLPHDFFPEDGKWYKNSKRVHKKNGKQKYIGKKYPKYRK